VPIESIDRAAGVGVSKRWLTFAAVATACVVLIWLPFGFSMTALIEDWAELGNMTRLGPTFLVDVAHPLSDVLRPLGHLPFALAYVSSPDSFVSWHVLLMLAFVLKGCASSELAYRACGSASVAIIAGVLCVIYPADTMQFPFRALHINWALALALLASCLCVAAWSRRDASTFLIVGASVLLLAAALMYEAALICLLIPFLVVFARDGLHGLTRVLRDRFALLLIWALSGAAYAVYAHWMAQKAITYEALLMGGQGWIQLLESSLPKLFSVGMVRAIYGGWIDAFGMAAGEYQSYVYLVVAAISLAGLAWAVTRKDHETVRPSSILRLAGIGLIATALGYFPYLFSPAHLMVSQRTFLYAAFGAAVFWSALLMGVRLVGGRLLFWCAASALILLGLAAQLFQFHYYVRIAQAQKQILRGAVENYDGNTEHGSLIVFDHGGYLGQTWMFLPANLRAALEYIYGHRLKRVAICHAQIMEWEERDREGGKGTCNETDDEWIFRAADSSPIADWPVRKSDAIVLDIGADGAVVPRPGMQAHQATLLQGQDGAARKYRAILADRDWMFHTGMFGDDDRSSQRHASSFSFGRWWSMDPPVRGYGWRGVEWDTAQAHPTAFAWKLGTNASLFFDLVPKQEEYLLQVKFAAFSSEKIRDALRISLNGTDVECRWLSFHQCEAHMAPGILHAGANEIAFISPIDPDYYGLSLSLTTFSLVPAKKDPSGANPQETK
jgi:hypothetical protein